MIDELATPRGRFAALGWGDESAPVTLCLHGFPDHPPSFAPLAGVLAARGHRVVAPWMRGYAPSPLDGPYDVASLAADVAALVAATGARAVVGHDWGAVALWAALADLDIDAACAIAVAHPLAVAANLPRSLAQLRRSGYMATLAMRPDRLARDGFAMARRLWQRWSPGYRLGDAAWRALRHTLEASHPAPALYYRALFWPPPRPAVLARLRRPIDTPMLSVFGADDGCMAPETGAGQERFVTAGFEALVIPDAGHFVHLERPERVAAAIGELLS